MTPRFLEKMPLRRRINGEAVATICIIACLVVVDLTLTLPMRKTQQRNATPAWHPYLAHARATWYAKPGDRWSRRYPTLWLLDRVAWPYTMGEFDLQCAHNGLAPGTFVRLRNRRLPWLRLPFKVTDRGVPWFDLTYRGYRALCGWPGSGNGWLVAETLGRTRD